ncbi:carbohydrate ABC transporter membrane protein 1 (CUT1 family) [Litoreibacter meonggei]|uniref:Carbohydrate ABC transporter membrane protein 1 (CUT1 family) n=1 Tax=Litoreibacter meonggei TaxID=1049199 RepID=A0A497V1U4_9RHOB|nr:sugar ABC transporter permease [Litoreibacter meonggei]RLJ36167.1 carbohydrate ABC transporter membrane protein 1 (CUT1 family) [Litoreibacter meonggei]
MKHSSFFWFVLPSTVLMLLFIAMPIVSVVTQSFYTAHEQVILEVENCGPFGCTQETSVDQEATAALREAEPLGKFAGFDIYTDRNHLAFGEVAAAWVKSDGLPDFGSSLMNLPFYKALGFTLTYTAIVTPLTIVLGFIVAIAVNAVAKSLRGPTIFFSLLPMIVTPLVGSLILFWMVDARGILGTGLQWLADDPNLSVKASTGLMWIMLMVYGVWHAAPFAFVVFYAGLQTVNTDTLESAMVDGATRWERIRYVVVPHLMPLVTFVALIQLMDNFRVFEPIISFQASAHATSLSYAIFNDLGGETRLLSSAAATSVLTIIGIGILLSPVLVRTWRDFNR